jgi:hypothetical protein
VTTTSHNYAADLLPTIRNRIEKMNLEKQDCIESIVHALNRGEVWRTKLMVKLPNDSGNIRAARMLNQEAQGEAARCCPISI